MKKAAAVATAFSRFPVAWMERSAIRATNLFLPSAVLHAKRLVAAAAFLADRGEIRLERVEILDLALGLANDLGEARDLGIEAGLVFPHLRRSAVVALGLHALGARRKQVRQLLGGILALRQRALHRGLVVRLLALDHRCHCAGVLAIALHQGLDLLDGVLLCPNRAHTQQERAPNNQHSLHSQSPFP